jgi:hypothetical protein
MRNNAVRDWRRDFAAVSRPLSIFSGADDELMFADKYVETVRGAAVPVDVRLIEGIDHMGIVGAPNAVAVIAEDVATRGVAAGS